MPPRLLLQGAKASEYENGLDGVIGEGDYAPLYLSPEPGGDAYELLAEPPVQFTKRQIEVLTLLAAQCDANQIAAQLGITPATVNYHKRNIHQKLGVQPEDGAVYTAVELLPHLLDDETE
jgi:DNA-binding CsgD family transcriptional regulator